MKKLFLILCMVLGFLFLPVAFAQAPSLDPSSAFMDVGAFALFIAGWVAFARDHVPAVKALKGLQVAFFSMGVGLLIGGAGQYVYVITLEPFASWGKPFGGLALGLFAGFTASGGFDLIRDFISPKKKTGDT
jgi:ABC-type spermidine/putrescine transport system permease subunit II